MYCTIISYQIFTDGEKTDIVGLFGVESEKEDCEIHKIKDKIKQYYQEKYPSHVISVHFIQVYNDIKREYYEIMESNFLKV